MVLVLTLIFKREAFQTFKRFHHERAGSGIGLYLTKLIVENYNGKICKSEVGKGTTVKIDFRYGEPKFYID
jgi:signal transduction histidine kinase